MLQVFSKGPLPPPVIYNASSSLTDYPSQNRSETRKGRKSDVFFRGRDVVIGSRSFRLIQANRAAAMEAQVPEYRSPPSSPFKGAGFDTGCMAIVAQARREMQL